jgi:hypothetical protein
MCKIAPEDGTRAKGFVSCDLAEVDPRDRDEEGFRSVCALTIVSAALPWKPGSGEGGGPTGRAQEEDTPAAVCGPGGRGRPPGHVTPAAAESRLSPQFTTIVFEHTLSSVPERQIW